MGKIEIFKGKNDKFYFRIKAANGETLAISEGYETKQNCEKGIESVKENKDIYSAIKLLSAKIPVVMTTQCINGIVDMNVYSAGRQMKSAGVISAGNMSPETAFIKLSWLLSNFSKEEVLEFWDRNFVGEKIKIDKYLDFSESN